MAKGGNKKQDKKGARRRLRDAIQGVVDTALRRRRGKKGKRKGGKKGS